MKNESKIKVIILAIDKKDYESYIKHLVKTCPSKQLCSCDFAPCFDKNTIPREYDVIMTTPKAENIIQCYLELEIKRRNKK